MTRGAPARWLVSLLAAAAWLAACATSAPPAPAARQVPPGVSYQGGDGLSCKTRVIIEGAEFQTGIAAEYAWLSAHYPGFKRRSQTLIECEGKRADRLDITLPDGREVSVFFDVSGFFGKGP